MAQWKQFGDVILNLDRVVKIERKGDAVKVYLAGLLAQAQSGHLGAADATPGARTFGGEEARKIWDYFCGLTPGATASSSSTSASSQAQPAMAVAGAR